MEREKVNIILVGFMGTGKSLVGKKLAQMLKMDFIDTDELIEKRMGMSIGKIFSKYGESFFRRLEREVVAEVSRYERYVIATGGGIVLNSENIEDLKKKGIIICLLATPEAIYSRTRKESTRPLLKGNQMQMERIRNILKEREPYYNQADYFIDTTDLSVEEVTSSIRELLLPLKRD